MTKTKEPTAVKKRKIDNELFESVVSDIIDEFEFFKGQIEIDGKIYEDGEFKQNMNLSFFNAAMISRVVTNMSEKSDCSDWYFTGHIIYRKDDFKPIKRSNIGKGTQLLFTIKEYVGEYCYIPTDGACFIKCVNYVLKRDLTKEFNDFIYSYSKHNRNGIMTQARIGEFNKKNETLFQIYNPKDRSLYPRKIDSQLEWVLYLHNNHFCLIKRDNKSLGIKEIKENYEQVWKSCVNENIKLVSEFNPASMSQNTQPETLYAWDSETYTEKETGKTKPYACSLVNLEKLRKILERINFRFPDLKPTDNVPEEFYDKIMKIVYIFVGTDCIDQMLKHLGTVDQKQLTLVSHNGSGFDNWIIIKNMSKLTHCPLKTNRGILRLPISNLFTEKSLQKKWKYEKEFKSSNNYLQKLNFTCSYQHVARSLKDWGKSSELPMNLRKVDLDIASINESNWESRREEWEPYAKRDTICLGVCLIKYNQVMTTMIEQSVINNLTAPALTLKGWYHLYKGEKVYSHVDPFIRHYVRRSVKGGRVSANIIKFKSDKLDEICKVLQHHLDTTDSDIIELFKKYKESNVDLKEELKKISCSKLMAFDANGLYASAMCDGEYPKTESARAITEYEQEEFVKLFNKQQFRPRCAILSVWFEYPTNMFFQPIPAKDKITYTVIENGKSQTKSGDKIRFRNGFCNDVLTSVDIQEIVRAGGKVIKILDGIVYEENFKTPPFKDYILTLKEERNKYKKKGNLVGSDCMKLLGNSLYGKTVQKDIDTEFHLWSEETLKANFDSNVKSYEKVNEDQYIVQKQKEQPEIIKPTKTTRSTPSHLGSFILAHSKRIMNNFIHVIDGFRKPEIYYTDTDSLYISDKNWDILEQAGLTSETEYGKGKNDYGDGGIIFGLYLAPKVKYNIILTSNGELVEKKTFKGYTKSKLSVEDYLKLANGEDIENEFDKPWKKSFTDGVVIPKDKQMKVFKHNLNLIKRKPPNRNGIMYPYNNKKEVNMDENYEFDDYDYILMDEDEETCN